ncbi:MATE family efflux transporter [Halogeometricum sp. S1BR25-6]|uniref:Multidrug-efflux transporter n=1 Tax=Halogeometricum salsisoli TaxID=2950536 RepID=A0ABU2GH03_9EURY|nr:MATE family efflux transporter [Halogeometricum sp. S1BR25-6]MDS0300107.1 MATE family efflux transporter [Halogeometricum sp. S1BR25-6]
MGLADRLGSLFKGREEFDLTEGGIARPLFYLSLPIVVTNLFQTAYNLADTFWLGQYSTDALAAISFAFPMVFLLISLGMGLSVAGSVLVAQHTGSGEPEQAEYAASQTLVFALITSAVLGVIGYLSVERVLGLLGASPDVLPGATAYMEVVSLGIPFMFGFFVFVSLMRGYGDTITPMLVMFGSVVVNIVIDPFLINGWWRFPEMGIEGAAVATIFSRGLAAAVGIAIMLRGDRGVTVHLDQMVPDFTYARRLVEIGAPASVGGMGRALSINALLVIVGTFSSTVVAGYGIGTRMFSVVFLPAIAFARGVETMTGQNIGAGKEDRAARTNDLAAKVLFGLLTLAGVVVFLAAEPITAVFTNDPAVVDVGATFLRYVAPTFGFIGIMRAYAGGFRGAGKTIIAATIAILTQGVVRIPIAWFASRSLGSSGIWLAFAVSNAVGATIAYLWFRRGTWRQADLTGSAVDGGERPRGDAPTDD